MIVTDDQGDTYSDTIAVAVLSKTEMDTLLKAKWEEMKVALESKDIEDGIKYFLSSSKGRYRYLFNAILNQLSDMVSEMRQIEMVSLEDGVAEYRIKRMEDIELVTYYIYFVLSEDGIWRIQQF